MPMAYHTIKQVNTHPSKHKTGSVNPLITQQKVLRPCSVSPFRAPQLASSTPPPSAVATNLLITPSSFSSSPLHRRQKERSPKAKCYSYLPERNPFEINNNARSKNIASDYRNCVEIETARELAAREFTWFDCLRELLGHTGNDPGHWNFSPEWWGSQGGGFGRTEGQVVFSKQSEYNGLVEVTAHPASLNGFSSEVSSAYGDETRQEWRVLRFNNVTRQSVARVTIIGGSGDGGSGARLDMQQRWWLESNQSIIAQPDCVAAEYLKTLISVFGALVGLQGLFQSSGKRNSNGATTLPSGMPGRRQLTVLCIGLGGGTLPHFIARHFPQAHVDAVEIDPVVVEAAIQVMGLPVSTLSNLRLHTRDAFEYLRSCCGDGKNTANVDTPVFVYDVVCIDAFDGDDNIPAHLCSSEFADMLGRVLDTNHGTVLVNLHETNDVSRIGRTFYDALVLGDTGGRSGTGNEYIDNSSTTSSNTIKDARTGCCFTIDTQKQGNLTLACARGLDLPLNVEKAKERLRYAGVYVGHESGYRFPAGARAEREFVRLF
ncbi:hypothetical protein Ndes2526A_g00197 [Nannochloris sp. 'desiccata']